MAVLAAEACIRSGAGRSGAGRPLRAGPPAGQPALCPCRRGAPPCCCGAGTRCDPRSRAPAVVEHCQGSPPLLRMPPAGPSTALQAKDHVFSVPIPRTRAAIQLIAARIPPKACLLLLLGLFCERCNWAPDVRLAWHCLCMIAWRATPVRRTASRPASSKAVRRRFRKAEALPRSPMQPTEPKSISTGQSVRCALSLGPLHSSRLSPGTALPAACLLRDSQTGCAALLALFKTGSTVWLMQGRAVAAPGSVFASSVDDACGGEQAGAAAVPPN